MFNLSQPQTLNLWYKDFGEGKFYLKTHKNEALFVKVDCQPLPPHLSSYDRTGFSPLYNGELDKCLRKGMNGNVLSTCIRWWDRSYGNMMILIFVNENYRLRLIKASPALTNPSVWRHLVRLHVLKGKWWSCRRLCASQTDVQSSSRHHEDSVCLSAPRWVKLRAAAHLFISIKLKGASATHSRECGELWCRTETQTLNPHCEISSAPRTKKKTNKTCCLKKTE